MLWKVLHTSGVCNKTLSRRESCVETEGYCAVPWFHYTHHTRADEGSRPSANRDADDGGDIYEKLCPNSQNFHSLLTLDETHVATFIVLLFLFLSFPFLLFDVFWALPRLHHDVYHVYLHVAEVEDEGVGRWTQKSFSMNDKAGGMTRGALH